MDEPGSLVAGRYELVEIAGSGGMATVWRAIQRGAAGFERPVGLKRVKAQFAHDRSFREMFVEEARVAAQLVHPNIVQIYDFGVEEGRYFLVMEWVEGINLARFCSSMVELGSLPPWTFVAAVGIEALRGLGAAHERIDGQGQMAPIFHRDVTPQNILIGTNGVVKLTDFGLARATDRARMTEPDVIKGKVGYLAPELPHTKTPNARTDIYALGVSLWQSLSGRRLFEGRDQLEIFLAAKQGEVPPVAEFRPDVPQAFASIVERALARDPEDRFESAAQMARVIARLLRTVDDNPDASMIGQSVGEVLTFLRTGQTR
ncbi:MAG: serine/threonine protein kinase [Myxococcales bacterium]|nr:serine/threonine protein kinase [Myxococcales bacterium]